VNCIYQETSKQLKNQLKLQHSDKWTKKQHEQFLRQTSRNADTKNWSWLTTGSKETEGFFLAGQYQAPRTNACNQSQNIQTR